MMQQRHEPQKPVLEHFIFMGDSLTDRGTMYKRKLFGLFPMAGPSGLKKKRSWFGSFTQQYTWANPVAAFIASQDMIDAEEAIEKRKHPSDPESPASRHSDLADEAIDGRFREEYALSDDRRIHLEGHNFLRSYAEGGATSNNYAKRFTFNPKLFFTRKIVSNLEEKRRLLLEDDRVTCITMDEKEKTLVVEWSGANDLITVNSDPTIAAADRAVDARIKNVKALIKQGYRHFALFNLPNLALTPRYQRKPDAERTNAERVSNHFNTKLADEIRALQRSPEYAGLDCSFNEFDVNAIFQDAYHHPEDFLPGVSIDRAEPFTESPEFKAGKDKPLFSAEQSAHAWFFWDDVHPMSKVHAILGNAFFKTVCKEKYTIKAPDDESLVQMFRGYYGIELLNDKRGWFGLFRRSRIDYTHELSLETIFRHALKDGGHRTKKVITELGWINEDGNLTEEARKNTHIEKAYKHVCPEATMEDLFKSDTCTGNSSNLLS